MSWKVGGGPAHEPNSGVRKEAPLALKAENDVLKVRLQRTERLAQCCPKQLRRKLQPSPGPASARRCSPEADWWCYCTTGMRKSGSKRPRRCDVRCCARRLNRRTGKAPGARMLLPSPMHEVVPVHHESRSRRDQAQLTHDHDLSQPRSRSSCHSSCLRPGWPAERGGAAVISTVHEAWPAARARRASGRGAAARWRAGGPDGGRLAVSRPVEALML